MALVDYIRAKRRREALSNALRESYEPGDPGFDPNISPETAEYDPGAAFQEEAGMGATQGGPNVRNALNMMYQGEGDQPVQAFQLEQSMRKSMGQDPSSWREWQKFSSLPESQKEAYLTMKRANRPLDVGSGYVTQSQVDPTRITPIPGAEKQLGPTETMGYQTESEKAKLAGREAGKVGAKAFDQVGKIQTNIRNLAEVVRLVGEGAETGPLADKLPSFKAATIELENLQKQLGLDVIGSVTFGALSKGELDLALSKALPTQLDGPELVKWAMAKIEAQKKLADYYQQQATYLSQPGSSLGGWLNQKGMPGAGQSPTGQNVKKIGDRTYINVNGQWFEQ